MNTSNMNNNEKINVRFGVLAAMVVAAALTRLIPPPYNFSPVGAMALFGGAYFVNKWAAFLVPLCSLLLSDIILNNVVYAGMHKEFTLFYEGAYWVYGSFALMVFIGSLMLKETKSIKILSATLLGSLLFFIITNFGVWASGTMYPHTIEGLTTCYILAIPYFEGTLAGDLFFSAVMFGAFEFAKTKYPVLALR